MNDIISRAKGSLRLGPSKAALLIGLGAVFGLTHAASFDCRVASTSVEKSICESPSLNRLDEELANLYGRLNSAAANDSERASIRDRQRKWLREDRNACRSTSCIGLSIWQRAAEIRATLERAGLSPNDIPETTENANALDKMLAAEMQPTAPISTKPVVGQAAAAPVASSAGRTPSNPGSFGFCTGQSKSASRFTLCDSKTYVEVLSKFDDEAERELGFVREVPLSKRAKVQEQALAPAYRYLDQTEAICPGLDIKCLKNKVSDVAMQIRDIIRPEIAKAKVEQAEGTRRKFNKLDAEPVSVSNGGAGATHVERYGGNFTWLNVTNRTAQGLKQVDVSCGLYEDWSADKPIDPAELRYSIKGNIAPNSSNFGVGPIPVPWNAKEYGTDAQVIICRVTATVASSSEDAKAAVSKREADSERVSSARTAMLADGDRRREDANMDQTVRLRNAILAARDSAAAGNAQCQALAQTWTREMRTIQTYQDQGLKPQAASLVDGALGQFRQYRCIK